MNADSSSLDTYIICSTPRTGSTLLCELLSSTGVAGNPHSYFRAQDMDRRASDWGLPKAWSFDAYLEAVRRLTATPNGVLGLRIMWGTLDEILDQLRLMYENTEARALLEEAFGNTKYIHLRREDVVAQAISLFKAEASNYWHSTQSGPPSGAVGYNHDEIANRVESLQNDDAAWTRWFESLDIEPLQISYEALDSDPVATSRKVLNYLGLAYRGDITAPNLKLADQSSEHWKQRFLLEASDAKHGI